MKTREGLVRARIEALNDLDFANTVVLNANLASLAREDLDEANEALIEFDKKELEKAIDEAKVNLRDASKRNSGHVYVSTRYVTALVNAKAALAAFNLEHKKGA